MWTKCVFQYRLNFIPSSAGMEGPLLVELVYFHWAGGIWRPLYSMEPIFIELSACCHARHEEGSDWKVGARLCRKGQDQRICHYVVPLIALLLLPIQIAMWDSSPSPVLSWITWAGKWGEIFSLQETLVGTLTQCVSMQMSLVCVIPGGWAN